jgi:FkbM family methyltransferase
MVRCRLPPTEILFNAIIAGLFNERRIPPGSVIDAGALTGEWTCMYAGYDRSRTVHGIDPLRANIDSAIRNFGAEAPNMHMHVGGLGAQESVADFGPKKVRGQMVMPKHVRVASESNTSFPIHTLDKLFSTGGLFGDEKLAFAHIDVEGHELNVFRGARAVLARDQPLIAFELQVHRNIGFTIELLGFITAAGYDSFLVEEPCGVHMDCRNIISFPRSRRLEFADSPTLHLASVSSALQAVNVNTIAAKAFPCCARGGQCCPARGGCCTFGLVHEWLEQQGTAPPFSRASWTSNSKLLFRQPRFFK